jgi:hypothetical protein
MRVELKEGGGAIMHTDPSAADEENTDGRTENR